MQITTPSKAETQLTGRLGQMDHKIRSVTYSVVFVMQAGEIASSPWRNGLAIDWSPITRKMAAQGVKFFASFI